jgi:hypothetical protein
MSNGRRPRTNIEAKTEVYDITHIGRIINNKDQFTVQYYTNVDTMRSDWFEKAPSSISQVTG